MAHAQTQKLNVQLIQGGTSSRTKGKLRKAIAAAFEFLESSEGNSSKEFNTKPSPT